MASPAHGIAQLTKSAAAPTKTTKGKVLGAKRAKIYSIYFPKLPQTKGGKSESAAKKKQAELAAAYGSLGPQAGGGRKNQPPIRSKLG